MNNLSALIPEGTSDHKAPRKEALPVSWSGLRLESDGSGSIVTEPRDSAPSSGEWRDLISELLPVGMNPDDYIIDERFPVEIRAWDSGTAENPDKRSYYFKARIMLANSMNAFDPRSYTEFYKRSRKITVKNTEGLTPRVAVLHYTDLQSGQADGDGVQGLIERSLQIPELFKQYIKEEKKAGRAHTEIFIPITGDLVEGVQGFYANQTFTTGQNNMHSAKQVEVATELLLNIISEVAKIGLPVHVAAVPGNHGENNRVAGKQITSIGDNNDIAVVKNVKRVLDFSNKFDHVRFSIPKEERFSLIVQVLDLKVSLTHGHIARGGATPEAKIINWSKNMMLAGDPVGDYDILFTGHYHHQKISQLNGNRWWIMSPAMCDISGHFAQTLGLVSAPGISFYTLSNEQKLEGSRLYTFNTLELEERKIQ